MQARVRVAVLLTAAAALAFAAAPDAAPGPAGAGGDPRSDYERSQRWRFSARPLELPADGFAWEHEGAEWRLESGRVWLQEPAADGAVTGLVFEGDGRFRLAVPDPFELAQLRRFAGDDELEALDERFDKLVLRTADRGLLEPLAELAGEARAAFEPHRLARDRHDFWLRIQRLDADARVVAARLGPGKVYLRAGMKTRRFGWLAYDYNSRRPEETRVERFHRGYAVMEHWLSLDREADRTPDGRPGAPPGRDLDVEHVDVSARLLELGKDPGLSETLRHTTRGEFRARIDFRVARPGLRALQFFLHPWAEVRSVVDADGAELDFLRHHIGGRSGTIDKRVYDHSLVVLVPEPLAADRLHSLTFEYDFDVYNYVPGRAWYPGVETVDAPLRDLHTARIEVTAREADDVRSMGELEAEESAEGLVTRRWRVERPAKMVTFSFARKVQERRLAGPDGPEVIVFSPPLGADSDGRLEEIGVDVTNSYAFYSELLGVRPPAGRLQATMIQAFHGQAFDGFLHLGEESAFRKRTGPTELFIAHEVAHQWWGHLVGWESYRDQWLSEGLSQYMGLLYIEAALEDDGDLFRDALAAHRDQVIGSIQSQLSPFARPGLPLANKKADRRIGPIGHGYRAVVGESPAAYFSQTYHKSALVLHMLREIARLSPPGEQAFYDVLRDFCRASMGGHPGTDDFAAAVERHYPAEYGGQSGGDWDWFFDQWIRGAEIPAYRWKVRLTGGGPTGHRVELEVEQRRVPEGFKMLVPVRVELAGGDEEEHLVWIDRPRQTLVIEVSAEPRKAVFNPDSAILAR